MVQNSSVQELPFPQLLELPQPPKKLYLEGTLPSEDSKLLTIVGSRKCTSYGKEACTKLIQGLAGYNISIVSGLALGIDGHAHRTALEYGLHTIAVPGSGLGENVLYPASHRSLARDIVARGGLLLSEFEPDFKATQWSFPQRNRLMAGMSHGVLVIEATEKSGTLITARLTTEYNKELMVVPGSIFSEAAKGSNKLITQGATPVQSSDDILEVLGIEKKDTSLLAEIDLTDNEQHLWKHLADPLSRDELSRVAEIDIQTMNVTLTMLEIKELIHESGGKIYRRV